MRVPRADSGHLLACSHSQCCVLVTGFSGFSVNCPKTIVIIEVTAVVNKLEI